MPKIKMMLFKKTIEYKEGEKKGQKYDTYFMKFPNGEVFISTKLTNELKAKLLLEKVQFPMEIELLWEDDEINPDTGETIKVGQKDYFMTVDHYNNKFGEPTMRDVCVIQDYRSVKHLDMNTKSLEDYFIEMTKGVDTSANNN